MVHLARIILVGLALGSVVGCKKPKNDDGQKVTIAGNPGPGGGQKSETQKAKVVREENGVTVAEIDGEHANLIEPKDAPPGTAIVFPAGTVPSGTLITVEPATTLADVGTLGELGFDAAVQGFLASGEALAVTASGDVQAMQPFQISLAIPAVEGGAGLQDPYATLAIVYHAKVPGEAGYRLGIYPRAALRIENGIVSFDTQLFGVYQAVILVRPVDAPKEIVTATAFETQTQAEALPKVAWSSSVEADGRSRIVRFEVTGLGKLASCKLALDADGVAPPDEVRDVGRHLEHVVEPLSDEEHALIAVLTCIDVAGRKSSSGPVEVEFEAAVADAAEEAAAVAAAAFSATPEPGQIGLTVQAGDAQTAGFLVVRRAGSAVTWTPADGEAYVSGGAVPVELPDGQQLIADAPASGSAFVDLNLDSAVTYHYAVFAYDAARRHAAAAVQAAQPTSDAFNRAAGFDNGVKGLVKDDAVTGKWYAFGFFLGYGGARTNQLVRFNADFSRDTSFQAPLFSGQINAVLPLPDGKLLVGGSFERVGDALLNNIARLNSDGSYDGTIDFGSGFDDAVRALALAAGGEIYAGGSFEDYRGTTAHGLVRLQADSYLLDPDFVFTSGPDAGFDVPGGDAVRALAVDPATDGVFVGGVLSAWKGTSIRPHIAFLTATGNLVGSFHGATSGFNAGGAVGTVVWDDANDRLYVGGTFTSYAGTAVGRIAGLDLSGALLGGFDTDPGAQGEVRSLRLDAANSKLYAAGFFTSYDNTTSAPYLVRLGLDGVRDTSFAPALSTFTEIAAPDGSGGAIVGGYFTKVGDVAKNRIVRLDATGGVTSGFDVGSGLTTPPGASNERCSLLRASDGKLYVGSMANRFHGVDSPGLVRLGAHGALDATFAVGAGFVDGGGPGIVQALVEPADGGIIAAGAFTSYAGAGADRIVKLTATGARDGGFLASPAFDGTVHAMVGASDGKLYVGGAFTQHGATPVGMLARLNADGSLDSGYAAALGAGFDGDVIALARHGSFLYAGGSFTTFDGAAAPGLVRLTESGARDASFDVGAGFTGGSVRHILVDPASGDVYVAGAFTQVNGQGAAHVVRLGANGALAQSYSDGPSGAIDGSVSALALGGGRLYVGGSFQKTTVGLARLLASGVIDPAFLTELPASPGRAVYALDFDPVRREIYACGDIGVARGQVVDKLARFDATGKVD